MGEVKKKEANDRANALIGAGGRSKNQTEDAVQKMLMGEANKRWPFTTLGLPDGYSRSLATLLALSVGSNSLMSSSDKAGSREPILIAASTTDPTFSFS